MTLISMKNTKPAEKATAPGTLCGPHDEYPWGLRIYLEEEQLKALQMGTLPSVGTELTITAKVKVSGQSANETVEEGTRRSLNLQITELALGGPPAPRTDADRAERLYTGEGS